MRNIPIRGHLCSTLPVVHRPPLLLLFFSIADPLYVDHSIDSNGTPQLEGDLRGCSIVQRSRKGCLKYARLIFLHSFSTRSHLSLSLSFSPFFFPASPLPFPVVPAIVRSNEESRRDIGRGNVRMTQQMRWNEITSVPGFIVSPAGAQELCFFLAKLL